MLSASGLRLRLITLTLNLTQFRISQNKYKSNNCLIVSVNEDEGFALLTTNRANFSKCDWCSMIRQEGDVVMAPPCGEKHILYITKYNTKSSLLKDVAPLPLAIIHVKGRIYCSLRKFYLFTWWCSQARN